MYLLPPNLGSEGWDIEYACLGGILLTPIHKKAYSVLSCPTTPLLDGALAFSTLYQSSSSGADLSEQG